jgi:hypothetical protein
MKGRAARNQQLIAARQRGASGSALARRFRITPQRVYQIVGRETDRAAACRHCPLRATLSGRALKILDGLAIRTVDELRESTFTALELLSIKHCGRKTCLEILDYRDQLRKGRHFP